MGAIQNSLVTVVTTNGMLVEPIKLFYLTVSHELDVYCYGLYANSEKGLEYCFIKTLSIQSFPHIALRYVLLVVSP